MKKTLRTFVAVEISEPIRARAEELIDSLDGTSADVNCEKGDSPHLPARPDGCCAQMGTVPFFADVNWVEPHNLHLTLKFLGDVHEREITRVCQAVARGASRVGPFELEVRGAGAFPNAARPRTVWLGAGEGAEPMVALHDHVEAALAELGFREEHRRFQPHLTLGRVRGAGPSIAELGARLERQADFSAGRMTVGKIAIFSSTLTSEGPIYSVVAAVPLGGVVR